MLNMMPKTVGELLKKLREFVYTRHGIFGFGGAKGGSGRTIST